ncbi:MAG: cell division protein FtsH, partial [Leptolyngbya sp. SIO4C5]|nr:cell division protein FtsH [Leptolyngbya sp. SIO4C5]
GGFASYLPKEDRGDDGLMSYAELVDMITLTLGGRASEKIVFGEDEVTQGASNDIQQVTNIARQMVTKFGMSELGSFALENSSGEVFLGRDLMPRSEFSEEMAAQIDNQVRNLVKACYDKACELLEQNRTLIDRLVDLLLEKETLSGEEFRQIVSEHTELPEKELAKSGAAG